MLSKIPIELDKIKKDDLTKEILRAAIIAELDAINLYEQMAAMKKITGRFNPRRILLGVLGLALSLLGLGQFGRHLVRAHAWLEQIDHAIGPNRLPNNGDKGIR